MATYVYASSQGQRTHSARTNKDIHEISLIHPQLAHNTPRPTGYSHIIHYTGIFHPYMLNVKQPSQLYFEGDMGNYTMMRMKGNKLVNAALDSQLERESRLAQKSYTITLCNTKL